MRTFVIALLVMGLFMGKSVASTNKTVFGYVEKVTLVENNITLSAKLDSGAKSASLSAIHIEEVTEHGKTFLMFTVPTKSGNFQYKAEYAGRVRIKSRVDEIHRTSLRRPMVRVKVRLGEKERDVTFNLTNRKRFNYPMLLGRDAIIAFGGVIDPSAAFLLRKDIHFEVVESHDKA